MKEIELDEQTFRYLLDLVYVGNWILNSARGGDRIEEYDAVESLVFSHCAEFDMPALAAEDMDEVIPSETYSEGGIHEAIEDYEDAVFFDILAEELARRDLKGLDVDGADSSVLDAKIAQYMDEFTVHGIDNISVRGF